MQKMLRAVLSIPKRFFAFCKRTVVRHPFASFLIVFSVFIGAIATSVLLDKQKSPVPEQVVSPKEVTIIKAGNQAMFETQAQVRKAGIATIVAQTGGVVQKVFRREGQSVNRGTALAWISTNYSGGTVSSLQQKQAALNYNFNKDSFEMNKQLISKQREVANTVRDNTEELRSINEKSISETKDLLSLNRQIMTDVDASIKPLEALPSLTDSQKSQLTSLRSQKSQVLSAINQLSSSLRGLEYSTNTDKPPEELANIQRDMTLKQLDLQDKSLDLQLELSSIGKQIAGISASLNYPASPFNGNVERIMVVPGQTVNPGEPLAVVRSKQTSATAEVLLPKELAQKVDVSKEAVLRTENDEIRLKPTHLSTQPTVGVLYSVTFQLPDDRSGMTDNGSYLKTSLPLLQTTADSAALFIPLDAVYQTADGAYVYLAEEKDGGLRAVSHQVSIGQVVGSQVEIQSGINAGDQIILDRNVLENETVQISETI